MRVASDEIENQLDYVATKATRNPAGTGVTLRRVGELAGVSHVTASLALRNDPRISQATKRKVQAAARRLGYRPDPHVAELMNRLRRSRAGIAPPVIAYVASIHPVYGVQDSPMARRLFRGAEARAAELGYRLERFLLGAGSLTDERISAILRARNIRGVLIGPLAEDAGRLRIDWSAITSVAFGFSMIEPALHRVGNYGTSTMRLALQTLQARGRTRWGLYLREGLDARVDHTWLSTYLHTWHLQHRGTPALPPLIRPKWDRDEFERWFRQHRPDAIVTIQLGVLEWLLELARVPEDVAFVHLDWAPEIGDVAGIDQQTERIGAAAIEQVAAQLSQHEYGLPVAPKTVYVGSAWREGQTVPPPV